MRRLVCLDGLRGALAFYVMLSHMMPFVPLPGWVEKAFSHGGAGVDVFFILSGLVIVQSLATYRYRSRPFLIARVARIYPMFLVVFGFSVVVQPLASGFSLLSWIDQNSTLRYLWTSGWPSDWAVGVAAHLTMTHGLFPDGVMPHVWLGFLGAAWSLSTEWQFYVLALLIGARMGLRPLAWTFLAASAASIVWHAGAPEAWQFSRAFLPNKAQYFALGIASAAVVRQGTEGLATYLAVLGGTVALSLVEGGIDKMLPPVIWTLCLAAQLLPNRVRAITAITESVPAEPVPAECVPAGGRRSGAGTDRRKGSSHGDWGWVAGPLYLLAAMLRSRPLVWLGAMSYGIYLVNEPVQKVLGLALGLLVRGNSALFTALWLPRRQRCLSLWHGGCMSRSRRPRCVGAEPIARRGMPAPVAPVSAV